eukprot:6217861-Pyramimonas_sp.AAC.1
MDASTRPVGTTLTSRRCAATLHRCCSLRTEWGRWRTPRRASAPALNPIERSAAGQGHCRNPPPLRPRPATECTVAGHPSSPLFSVPTARGDRSLQS